MQRVISDAGGYWSSACSSTSFLRVRHAHARGWERGEHAPSPSLSHAAMRGLRRSVIPPPIGDTRTSARADERSGRCDTSATPGWPPFPTTPLSRRAARTGLLGHARVRRFGYGALHRKRLRPLPEIRPVRVTRLWLRIVHPSPPGPLPFQADLPSPTRVTCGASACGEDTTPGRVDHLAQGAGGP